MALLKSKYLQLVNPVYMGDRPACEMKLSILSCGSEKTQMYNISSVDELIKYKNDSKMSWINVSGLKDIDSIKKLGELLEIHPLSIEDVLHTEQQAKMEVFDKYRFLSIKTIQHKKHSYSPADEKKKKFPYFRKKKNFAAKEDEINELVIDQISIIVMKNVLLTFQELSEDSFGGIRKKLLESTGDINKIDTDYIAYLIIDNIIDEYLRTLYNLEDYIEDFEDRAAQTTDNTFIEKIQETKKYLQQIRRAILPLKENLMTISRHELFFQTAEIKPFLQDLNENLNHAIALADHYREWLSNIMEVNLSLLSYQLNKVMKVMAMISSIFIPLSFIAAIYGMNFDYMPELRYQFAYFIVLGGLGLIALVMMIIFKIQRWF
ncbi:MAG: magnesium and cobalt transport protein CorA [Treponema sp.]|jgi:magnesium transporter|nr:magnesium and cobalt transport protein CorA [Treponema sp.]